MSKYYDINTAAEEAAKTAQPTPCELLQKVQFLQRDYDTLLMRYTKKCKERDDLMRTLDQTTVRLNDETARADALQKRCDDLEQSRKAWVEKATELDARADESFKYFNKIEDENHILRDQVQWIAQHPVRWLLRRDMRKAARSE